MAAFGPTEEQLAAVQKDLGCSIPLVLALHLRVKHFGRILIMCTCAPKDEGTTLSYEVRVQELNHCGPHVSVCNGSVRVVQQAQESCGVLLNITEHLRA